MKVKQELAGSSIFFFFFLLLFLFLRSKTTPSFVTSWNIFFLFHFFFLSFKEMKVLKNFGHPSWLFPKVFVFFSSYRRCYCCFTCLKLFRLSLYYFFSIFYYFFFSFLMFIFFLFLFIILLILFFPLIYHLNSPLYSSTHALKVLTLLHSLL